jgi:hypothetical protein
MMQSLKCWSDHTQTVRHVACVVIVARLQTRWLQVLVTAEVRDFTVWNCLDRLWYPPSLLLKGWQGHNVAGVWGWPLTVINAEAKGGVLPLVPLHAFMGCTRWLHIPTCYTHNGGNRKPCFGIGNLSRPATDSRQLHHTPRMYLYGLERDSCYSQLRCIHLR